MFNIFRKSKQKDSSAGERMKQQRAPQKGNRFDKFTERARWVLALAQEQARRLGHNYIGTEHILLGLVREKNGNAAIILSNLGIGLDKIRTAVEFIIGRGEVTMQTEIGLTPGAKKAIELAVDESTLLGHQYIGTEHLLLGLLREGKGVAAGVLESLGVSVERVHTELNRVLSQSAPHPAAGQPPAAKASTVEQFAVDLTAAARAGKLDPVIGRSREIGSVLQVLNRRTKKNPVLIGEPGVGKKAIVEAIAHHIILGDISETLRNARLLTLDISSLIANAENFSVFEERLKKLIEQMKTGNYCVLFIEEIHKLFGPGATEGTPNALDILRQSLIREEMQCIGATNPNTYRINMASNAFCKRYFEPIMIEEPSIEQTIEILRGIKSRYEEYHRLTINDEALKAAAVLGSKHISNRFLPEKAIDLIDEASSRLRTKQSTLPANLTQVIEVLEALRKEKEQAIYSQQYEYAAELRERELKLAEKIEKMRYQWRLQQEFDTEKMVVTQEHIAEVVSMWTGIPIARLMSGEAD